MRGWIGGLMMLAAVLIGAFVGLYVMLYGGIVQLVHGVTAHPVVAKNVAMGIIRIIFASGVGGLCAVLLWIPGFAILTGGRKKTPGQYRVRFK